MRAHTDEGLGKVRSLNSSIKHTAGIHLEERKKEWLMSLVSYQDLHERSYVKSLAPARFCLELVA